MPTPLESDVLLPSATTVVGLLLLLLVLVGLVVYPLVGAVRRQQVLWVVLVLVLAPVGGALWLLLGRGAPVAGGRGGVPRRVT